MTNQCYYGFVLGRNPAISATEIYLQFKNEVTELFAISSRLVIIGLKNKIADPSSIIDKLYGTVKIVELPEEIQPSENSEDYLSDSVRFIKLLPPLVHRITFGFSIYNINTPQSHCDGLKSKLIPLAYKLKKEFKAAGYNANFLGLKADEVTTNTINDKQMTTKGVDFVIIVSHDRGIVIGKTVAVQNTKDYEKRNYHRPARNLHSGIVPVKLARSMITFSGASLNDLVIDPFCGSGTIITELILMGFTNVVGGDNNETAVKETEANIKWLFENYPQTKEKQISWKAEVSDATLIDSRYKAKSVGAIVSEPYLGPIFKTNPGKETVNQLFVYLADLYLRFFKAANKCLKAGAKIIFIFPIIPVNGRLMYLDILDDVQKTGFKPVMPLPTEWRKPYLYEITNRNSFLVKKEGQIMIRELFVFEKTG